MAQFYAYLWLRKDGTPYYVGKGRGNRAFTSRDHTCHKPVDNSRILILLRDSEEEAFETEKELIANWGRKDLGTGCLRNLTDGGDGVSGIIFTKEHQVNAAKAGGKFCVENKIGFFNPVNKEICREGSRKAGKNNVESGHLQKISSIGGKVAGALAAKRNVESGHMSAVGKKYGGLNKEEHVAGSKRYLHIRWHVNRNIINSSCQYCK
jgi:hypothetical protein